MQRTSTEFGFKCRSDDGFTQHIGLPRAGDLIIDSATFAAGDIIGPILT